MHSMWASYVNLLVKTGPSQLQSSGKAHPSHLHKQSSSHQPAHGWSTVALTHRMSCLQMSIPQVKSMYQSSAHINQPCAPGSVSASCHLMHLVSVVVKRVQIGHDQGSDGGVLPGQRCPCLCLPFHGQHHLL